MSSRLIIEGNAVYEIDEECYSRKHGTGEAPGEKKTEEQVSCLKYKETENKG